MISKQPEVRLWPKSATHFDLLSLLAAVIGRPSPQFYQKVDLKTPFCVTDHRVHDDPIVYVSSAFESLTGYAESDCLGHNCRFLQGAETNPGTLLSIRRCIEKGEEGRFRLKNYRKNGEPFMNYVSIIPIFGPLHDLIYYLGVQSDVPWDDGSLESPIHERSTTNERNEETVMAICPGSPGATSGFSGFTDAVVGGGAGYSSQVYGTKHLKKSVEQRHNANIEGGDSEPRASESEFGQATLVLKSEFPPLPAPSQYSEREASELASTRPMNPPPEDAKTVASTPMFSMVKGNEEGGDHGTTVSLDNGNTTAPDLKAFDMMKTGKKIGDGYEYESTIVDMIKAKRAVDDDKNAQINNKRLKNYRYESHSVIEKRRRDRINVSLTQLSDLVPECREQSRRSKKKVDKAEVLEYTVEHVKKLNDSLLRGQQSQASSTSKSANSSTNVISHGTIVSTWGIDRVCSWLDILLLSQYTQNFIDNAVDGSLLVSLSDEELELDLKITNRLHRKKIMISLEQYKNQCKQLSSNSDNCESGWAAPKNKRSRFR